MHIETYLHHRIYELTPNEQATLCISFIQTWLIRYIPQHVTYMTHET